MADNNKVLIEELERRLIWYREEASDEEFDPDAVDAICTMLQKLSPIQEPYRTKEEVYENIMKRIRLEEEEFEKSGKVISKDRNNGKDSAKKRRFLSGKKGLRAAIVAIVVIGIFVSLNSAVYAKEKKSLFTMFLERVGVLKIVKDETVVGDLVTAEEAIQGFYNSWTDLDQEVKSRLNVPAYIPEGYALYGIRVWDFNNRKNLEADYYDQKNGHILIGITLWEGNEDHYRENVVDENNYRLVSEYSNEDTLYYAYEDEYICIIFGGNNFYRISGNISLEEMIKIGEGIGNR